MRINAIELAELVSRIARETKHHHRMVGDNRLDSLIATDVLAELPDEPRRALTVLRRRQQARAAAVARKAVGS